MKRTHKHNKQAKRSFDITTMSSAYRYIVQNSNDFMVTTDFHDKRKLSLGRKIGDQNNWIIIWIRTHKTHIACFATLFNSNANS